jgi:hypothetical protein
MITRLAKYIILLVFEVEGLQVSAVHIAAYVWNSQ